MVTLRVQVEATVGRRIPPGLVGELARRLGRAANRLNVSKEQLAGLGIRIVGDQEMTDLNERHRGKRQPTDVLSFRGDPEESQGLGDLVLDWDAVVRQAGAAHAQALLDEATSLAVHGLVHLLGYDHGRRHHARAMLRLERRAGRAARLSRLNRPYGGGG
jgi:probable rRNA maturation factor